LDDYLNEIVEWIAKKCEILCVMLLGNFAQNTEIYFEKINNIILKSKKMIFNFDNLIIKIMNYSNFEKIISNDNRQIYIYKFNNIINEQHIILFKKCFNDWQSVSDTDIDNLKDIIAKYTDNNSNIKGCVNSDTIELFSENHRTHYYIRFTDDNVTEIYYVEGCYQNIVNNEGFDLLLIMLAC
tara:strand:- start:576 stop:1124 length:549 start_codon:yes stop_codon:yes gene_type:complete